MNIRLTYAHQKGFFVETQPGASFPWAARTQPYPTVEDAIAQAASFMGQQLSFPLTSTVEG